MSFVSTDNIQGGTVLCVYLHFHITRTTVGLLENECFENVVTLN